MRDMKKGVVLKVLRNWKSELYKYRKFIIPTFILYGFGNFVRSVLAPIFGREIIDSLPPESGGNPWFWLMILSIAGLLIFVCHRVADKAIVHAQIRLIRDLKIKALDRVLKNSYEFFANTFAGSLVSQTKRFADNIERVYDDAVFGFFKIAIILVSIFIVMFIEVRVLAMLLLGWSSIFILITVIRARKQTRLDLEAAEGESRATGVLADTIENAIPTKTYTAHTIVMDRFRKSVGEEASLKDAAWGYMVQQWIINGVMWWILELAGMAIAIYQFQNGAITVGTVVMIQMYIASIGELIWSLGQTIVRTRRAFANAIEMSDIMDIEPELLDPVDPVREIDLMKGIHFHDVSFKYNGGDKLFNKFDLSIPSGQTVGFVGFSGSGKTSLTKILLRLIDITEGAILIGGVDVRDMTQNDLRSHIAFVPQDPTLFHISIERNIAFGRPDATVEEVYEAAKKAHIHDFISELPDGYNTLVGERGIKLSGGQRQRVAIARAILRNAHIIVLDEASSSLDSITEDSLQQVLLEEFKGKTVIVIAHRLSTVANLDRLIVLDNGVIVQDGNHKELATVEGVYKELWDRQSSQWLI